MSLTRLEALQRAETLTVASYEVALDLTRDPKQLTFGSRTRIAFHTTGGDTFVELNGAERVQATLDGQPLNGYQGRRLPLHGLTAGDHVLEVDAVLPAGTDGDGMYRFTDPADGQTYLSAYIGMDLAQRVFACFDQPDLKAPIRLTVTAPPEWTVLANGVPAGSPPDAGGIVRDVSAVNPVNPQQKRHALSEPGTATTEFTATPRISPYLFVICAGPWHSRTFTHADLPFGWHARASLADALDRDFEELKAITIACFDHYTTVFDPPYPFASYQQVLAPGQNWGALETPGCVTFRDEYLPRGQMSATERVHRATVIAHEMAHMWFGDLVTMRWWQDTWLNESFADYMGYHVADEAAGYPGARVLSSSERKPTGYRADERRSTHPVAPTAESVVDVDAAFGNFDMISYAKGNAVLQQLVTWLGEDAFLAGSNRYLTDHAFGNAELADFIEALDSATDRDARAWAREWLQTTGFDTIRCTRDGDVPVLHREGSRPHRLEVAAFREAQGGLRPAGSRFVDLADADVRLEEYAGLAVLPNSGDHTFARIRLDPQSDRAISAAPGDLTEAVARTVWWEHMLDRVRCAELAPGEHLRLIAEHLPREPHPVLAEGVLSSALGLVLPQLLAPGDVPEAERLLAGTCDRALDGCRDDELRVVLTRGLAATSQDPSRLQGWLDAGHSDSRVPLDPELRWRVVTRLAELGAGPGLVDAEFAADPSITAQLGAARARAARPEKDAKEQAWKRLFSPDLSNREFLAVARGFWTPGQHELVAAYLPRYLDEGVRAAGRSQGFAKQVGRAFPWVPLPLDQLQKLREDLARALAQPGLHTVLRREWDDRLDDVDVALDVRRAFDEQLA